jgi:hypothetical protein
MNGDYFVDEWFEVMAAVYSDCDVNCYLIAADGSATGAFSPVES